MTNKLRENLWTTTVAALLALLLVVYLFSFQVPAGYYGVKLTFGEFSTIYEDPGIHFKWPWPFQTVKRLDKRIKLFSTKHQECQTADLINMNIQVTAGWRITDPKRFITVLGTTAKAEENLMALVDSSRGRALGQYRLNDLVSAEDFQAQQTRFAEFESLMRQTVNQELAQSEMGVTLEYLAVQQLAFPTETTQKVFERMKAERAKESADYRAQGDSKADEIKAKAEAEASTILAKARADAEIIRGEGDAEAAKHYGVFQEHPDLANYLRKLKTLRRVLENPQATVTLTTEDAPFDMLRESALDESANGQ